MAEGNIQQKTFDFARRIVQAVHTLDKDRVGRVLAGQLIRSGTSIGANVKEAQAGQIRADFVAKLSIARKEAREILYWLRLFQAEGMIEQARADDLVREANSIVAILTAILKTTQQNSQRGSDATDEC